MPYFPPSIGAELVYTTMTFLEILFSKDALGEPEARDFHMEQNGFFAAEPLYISKQQEKITATTFPGMHGSLLTPTFADAENTIRHWENRSGSIDFYYLPDGKNHRLWDDQAMAVAPDRETEKALPKADHDHPWCFFGQYHRLMSAIQGRRAENFFMYGEYGGYGSVLIPYKYGDQTAVRPWVSKVKSDASSGRTTLTLSYEMRPGYPYGHENE